MGYLQLLWLPKIHQDYIERVHFHVEETLNSVSENTFSHLSKHELAVVYSNFDEIKKKIPGWKYLTLKDNEGRTLYPLREEAIPIETEDIRIFKERVDYQGTTLGELTLVYDLSYDIVKLKDSKRTIFWVLLVFLVLFFTVFTVIIDIAYLRPLAMLSNASKGVSKDQFDTPLPASRGNEVGTLVESFSSMRKLVEEKQKELTQARDVALIASNAKSEFLAIMSHELKTPMNAIVGFTDILKMETSLSEAQKESVNIISDSAAALLKLINEVLDFSNAEGGNLELNSETFDLYDLCHYTCMPMIESANEKGIRLLMDIRVPEGWEYLGDCYRVQQILEILLSNAIKFTHEGEVKFVAKMYGSPDAENRHQFIFTITDTGIGISPEMQGLVFDRFALADTSLTRHYEGIGLGLALAKQLTDLMQGELYLVSSQIDRGSIFEFKLILPVVNSFEA